MPTILIYDPSESARESIRDALRQRRDWELISASTNRQVISRLQDDPIDLIVTSAEVLQRNETPMGELQRAFACPEVPVIVLTDAQADAATDVESLLLDGASYAPCSTVAQDLVVTAERILTLTGTRRRHPRLKQVREKTETELILDNNNLDLVPIVARHLASMCEEFEVCNKANYRQAAIAIERAIRSGIVHGNLEVPVSLPDWDDQELHRLVRNRRQNSPWRDRKLTVHARFTPGEARFAVRDEGPGIDAADLPDPSEPGSLVTPHARGMLLIRQFMDEISFNEQGNTLYLVKRAPVSAASQQDAVAN